MSDIQRWDMNHVQGEVYIDKKPEGSWVTYADHLAAVAAARDECEHQYAQIIAFATAFTFDEAMTMIRALAAIDALEKP